MAKKKDKKSVEGYHWGAEPTWENLTEDQAKGKYFFSMADNNTATNLRRTLNYFLI